MSDFVVACRVDEVPPGKSKVIVHEKEAIAIFNVDGTFYAVNNRCPHAAGPLEYGFIENCRIICPWHGWSFPLSPNDPPNDGLPRYRTTIENDEVRVYFPPIEPVKAWR